MSELRLRLTIHALKTRRSSEKIMSKSALETGKAFLAGNARKTGIITTASGLQYEVLREGTGPSPKPSRTPSS